MHRLARVGVATLLAVSTTALTGCSFDPFKAEVPAEPTVNLVRAGRLLTQAETAAAVPTGAAAPSGFAVEKTNLLKPKKPDPHAIRPARCAAVYGDVDAEYVRSRTKSYRTYVNSDKTFLGLGVTTNQGSPVGVADALAGLSGCKTFVVQQGEHTLRITATPLSFAKMGEESVAIRFKLRAPTLRLKATYDVVRIKVGHNTVLADALSTTDVVPIPGVLEEAATGVLLSLSR